MTSAAIPDLKTTVRVGDAHLDGEDLMPAFVDALDVTRGEFALAGDLNDGAGQVLVRVRCRW